MMVLMDTYIGIGLGLLGLIFGSFAGAQVWRLRARQLREDKEAGDDYDHAEYARLSKLNGKRGANDRSRCLACGHELGVADLLPLVSWLTTGGKCRYCKQPIGWFEPVIELATMAVFVLSYIFWPFGLATGAQWLLFGVWLATCVLLVILAAYDIRWQLLPDAINYAFIALSFVYIIVRFVTMPASVNVPSVIGSVAVLAGLYGIIYIASKGEWIGFGDVKLGVGLGLLLADWRSAFLALFLANLIGCTLVLPGVLSKKLSGTSRIAFGPLLIAGMFIAFWWGSPFIDWLFGRANIF